MPDNEIAVEQNGDDAWSTKLFSFIRPLIIYLAFTSAWGYYTRSREVEPSRKVDISSSSATPLWTKGDVCSFKLFLSAHERHEMTSASKPVWEEHNWIYGSDDSRLYSQNITLDWGKNEAAPRKYVHAYLIRDLDKMIAYARKDLVTLGPKPSKSSRIGDLPLPNKPPEKLVPFWWPNVTFSIVSDLVPIPATQIPPFLSRHIHFVATQSNNQHYLPIFFANDFWILKDELIELNSTVRDVQLNLHLNSISFTSFQLTQQMEESFKMYINFGMESEIDEIRRMLRDTNPFLLALTFVVSLLHSVFEFLAFKNDVQFWQKRQTLAGVSLRSIVIQVVFQTITLLYLIDQSASWLIIVSSAVGIIIELWKIRQAGTQAKSYVQSKTKVYDDVAVRYLSIAAAPLLVAYAVYSFLNESPDNLYSWSLKTLVGFIYAFGFILMTPQVYINYKLKSVAHMPWRTFTYKALNTFIDDLFSFIIKMPTLHRLACFRDDVIFLIYLYQRWIYPVDKSRSNDDENVEVPNDSGKKDQ